MKIAAIKEELGSSVPVSTWTTVWDSEVLQSPEWMELCVMSQYPVAWKLLTSTEEAKHDSDTEVHADEITAAVLRRAVAMGLSLVAASQPFQQALSKHTHQLRSAYRNKIQQGQETIDQLAEAYLASQAVRQAASMARWGFDCLAPLWERAQEKILAFRDSDDANESFDFTANSLENDFTEITPSPEPELIEMTEAQAIAACLQPDHPYITLDDSFTRPYRTAIDAVVDTLQADEPEKLQDTHIIARLATYLHRHEGVLSWQHILGCITAKAWEGRQCNHHLSHDEHNGIVCTRQEALYHQGQSWGHIITTSIWDPINQYFVPERIEAEQGSKAESLLRFVMHPHRVGALHRALGAERHLRIQALQGLVLDMGGIIRLLQNDAWCQAIAKLNDEKQEEKRENKQWIWAQDAVLQHSDLNWQDDSDSTTTLLQLVLLSQCCGHWNHFLDTKARKTIEPRRRTSQLQEKKAETLFSKWGNRLSIVPENKDERASYIQALMNPSSQSLAPPILNRARIMLYFNYRGVSLPFLHVLRYAVSTCLDGAPFALDAPLVTDGDQYCIAIQAEESGQIQFTMNHNLTWNGQSWGHIHTTARLDPSSGFLIPLSMTAAWNTRAAVLLDCFLGHPTWLATLQGNDGVMLDATFDNRALLSYLLDHQDPSLISITSLTESIWEADQPILDQLGFTVKRDASRSTVLDSSTSINSDQDCKDFEVVNTRKGFATVEYSELNDFAIENPAFNSVIYYPAQTDRPEAPQARTKLAHLIREQQRSLAADKEMAILVRVFLEPTKSTGICLPCDLLIIVTHEAVFLRWFSRLGDHITSIMLREAVASLLPDISLKNTSHRFTECNLDEIIVSIANKQAKPPQAQSLAPRLPRPKERQEEMQGQPEPIGPQNKPPDAKREQDPASHLPAPSPPLPPRPPRAGERQEEVQGQPEPIGEQNGDSHSPAPSPSTARPWLTMACGVLLMGTALATAVMLSFHPAVGLGALLLSHISVTCCMVLTAVVGAAGLGLLGYGYVQRANAHRPDPSPNQPARS